jgi:hypothetical protein
MNNSRNINEAFRLIHTCVEEYNPVVVVKVFSDQMRLKIYFECSKPSPRTETGRGVT